MSHRLLAIHAHPDDESSKGAATLARYADTGDEVLVVTATGGEQGSILNPAMEGLDLDMVKTRHDEMEQAAKALGVEHMWLGYKDSGLPDDPSEPLAPDSFALVDNDEVVQKLVKIIREFKPEVLITYDENGGYPHPDHIKVHVVSMLAYDAAADSEYHPELGEPWSISKLYYSHGFISERFQKFSQYYKDNGLPNPFPAAHFWEANNVDDRVTTHVQTAQWFPQRDAALRAHKSQIGEDSIFLRIPTEIQRTLWPTEEFELAKSRINVELPEDDLFAGL